MWTRSLLCFPSFKGLSSKPRIIFWNLYILCSTQGLQSATFLGVIRTSVLTMSSMMMTWSSAEMASFKTQWVLPWMALEKSFAAKVNALAMSKEKRIYIIHNVYFYKFYRYVHSELHFYECLANTTMLHFTGFFLACCLPTPAWIVAEKVSRWPQALGTEA